MGDRIQLSEQGVDKIKSLMLGMPKLSNVPLWAEKVPEDVWKSKLLNSLEDRNVDHNETKHDTSTSKQRNTNQKSNDQQSKSKKKNHPNNKNKSSKSNKGN